MALCNIIHVDTNEKTVPIDLLRILETWFAIGSTCVKWCNFFSRSFVLSCGVRQGGVLSPYLFDLYTDSIFFIKLNVAILAVI